MSGLDETGFLPLGTHRHADEACGAWGLRLLINRVSALCKTTGPRLSQGEADPALAAVLIRKTAAGAEAGHPLEVLTQVDALSAGTVRCLAAATLKYEGRDGSKGRTFQGEAFELRTAQKKPHRPEDPHPPSIVHDRMIGSPPPARRASPGGAPSEQTW